MSFLLEKVSVDITALVLLGIIFVVSGLGLSEEWPSQEKLFGVFSSQAPITIAAMFIISASLNRCQIIEQASELLSNYCKLGYVRFTLVLFVLVAFVSAFINNTPVVVVLLPVVTSLSRSLGVSFQNCLFRFPTPRFSGYTCWDESNILARAS